MTDLYALVKDGVTLDRAQTGRHGRSPAGCTTAYPADYPAARGFSTTLTPWREVLVRNARPTLLDPDGRGRARAARRVRERRQPHAGAARPARARARRCARRSAPRRASCAGSCSSSIWCWPAAGRCSASRSPAIARGGLADYTGRLTLRADALQLNATVLAFSLRRRRRGGDALRLDAAPARAGRGLRRAPRCSGGQRSTTGRIERRAQRALVAVQIAISFVVLVGAGLLVRTFVNLQHVDPGFDETGVLVVNAPNMTRLAAGQEPRCSSTRSWRGVQACPGVQAWRDQLARAVRRRHRQRAVPPHGRGTVQPARSRRCRC